MQDRAWLPAGQTPCQPPDGYLLSQTLTQTLRTRTPVIVSERQCEPDC